MDNQKAVEQRSGVTKERSDEIGKRAWEFAGFILENKTDPENDARKAVFEFLLALSREGMSTKAVLGIETILAPADVDDIEHQYSL
jgi:hypothetical protein